jgi:hypothetical protein
VAEKIWSDSFDSLVIIIFFNLTTFFLSTLYFFFRTTATAFFTACGEQGTELTAKGEQGNPSNNPLTGIHLPWSRPK